MIVWAQSTCKTRVKAKLYADQAGNEKKGQKTFANDGGGVKIQNKRTRTDGWGIENSQTFVEQY
jgi:hypothetical protein